jgi:hypothetical protein
VLKGRNGHELGDKFAKNPYGYMAIAMNNFPNYFLVRHCAIYAFWLIAAQVNGPNAPIGQGELARNCQPFSEYVRGSLVPASEQQVDYICKTINKMRKQDIKSVSFVKCSANRVEHRDRCASRTRLWSSSPGTPMPG